MSGSDAQTIANAVVDSPDPSSPADPPITGWAGLLVPYDQPSVDGRLIRRPPGGARVRDLPIELKFQESATCGHDGALIGLASITRTWEDSTGLWGSGEFDNDDPRARELARKIQRGFIGHVSVDLGDFKTARQQGPSGYPVEAVTDWKLLSTTIVADAAMDGARIYAVSDPSQITSTADALAARRKSDGVFAAETSQRLTFAASGAANGLTLTITGATNLPWAPRNHRWSESAARRRMAERCGGTGELDASCYSRGFIFRAAGADPSLAGSYSFPFADVIDGELRAVFSAVSHAAGRVDQAGITSADKEAVRGRIRALYASAAKAFGDDTLTAPFDAQETTTMTTTEPAAVTVEQADLAGDVDALVERVVSAVEGAVREAVRETLESDTPEVDADEDGDESGPDRIDDMPATPGPRVPEMSSSVLRMAAAHAERLSRRRTRLAG